MNAKAVHAYNKAERHVVGIGELRVLVCEDAGEWFAQGVEIDYAASGDSLADVQRRFQKGLAATVHLHLTRFQSIQRLLKYPPPDVWRRFNAQQAYSFNMLTTHGLSNSVDALRELPFGQIVYLKEPSTHHATSAEG